VEVLRPLSGWWTSLPGGIEHNSMTNSAGNRFVSNLDYYGGGGTATPVEAGPVTAAPAPVPQPQTADVPQQFAQPDVPRDLRPMLASILAPLTARQSAPKTTKLTVRAGEGSRSLFG
jgi:hypothetical protein